MVKYGLSPRDFLGGAALGSSRGLRVYPESNPNTDIISFQKVIFRLFPVLPSEIYWKS